MQKIDIIIEEGIQNWITQNPVKTAAGVGAVGYGLGSGKLQPIAHKVINQSPTETWRDIKGSAQDTFDGVKDTKIADIPGNVADSISNLLD